MEWIVNWIEEIRATYGVNPYIFAGIYVGAIPFFWIAVWWLVRNLKKSKPAVGPVLMMGGCAVSSYIYLLIAGHNIPLWVYVVVVFMIVYGLYSAISKARQKKQEMADEA